MTCWTQALHEYLVASPPEGEDEDAIRALLCTPRRQIDQVPKTLASTLRAWLARSTELSCRYALSSALPYTEDFNRLGGPLLAWGLTRPWNKAIQFQQTLENWHGVLNEPGVFSDALATNMAYATHLVAKLLPQLSQDARLVAAHMWTGHVVATSPHSVLWQPNMASPDVRHLVLASWTDLHSIARMYSGAKGTNLWTQSVHASFKYSWLNHAQTALVLVRSSVPDDIKVRSISCANPTAWLDPELLAEMAPLLRRTSPDPAARLYCLPWTASSDFDSREQRVDFQRRLCESYCPELVPVFALYAVDWTDRISAFNVACMFTPSQETLDVAGLVGAEPH